MTDIMTNVSKLRDEVAALCKRLGRREPKILGATKKKTIDVIAHAYEAGIHCFGENYAQELEEKRHALHEKNPACGAQIEWHFIGKLQRNKVKKVVPLAHCIQTLDSLALAETIDAFCEKENKTISAMLEINVGGEATKGGILPEAARDFVGGLNRLKRMHLIGLMTIPPLDASLNQDRQFYKTLRELLDEINTRALYRDPLSELSMGMSHDYGVAIEEGSTLIRIGEKLFGPRT